MYKEHMQILIMFCDQFTESKTERRATSTYQNSLKTSERERQRSGESSGGWTWASGSSTPGEIWCNEGGRSRHSRYMYN